MIEENEELREGDIEIDEKIEMLEEEVDFLLKRLDGNDAEVRRSLLHADDLRLYRIKQEIMNLKKEKNENLCKIQKMRENQEVKNSNVAMLINKLVSVRRIPEENQDDDKVFDSQNEQIFELEKQVEKFQRKYEIQNNKCNCLIY